MTPWHPFAGCLCLVEPLAQLPLRSDYALEQSLYPRAPDARRQQAIAARELARRALAQLGGPMVAIGRGAQGAPEWPAGWTGSLAHSDTMAAALLGPARDYAALGIDLEPDAPLPEDASAIALDAVERRALAALPGGYARWSRAVFAAKECVHKCVHPLRGAWLEFDELRVHLDPQALTFTLEPLGASARAACAGIGAGALRYAEAHVVAALAIGRDAG